MVYKIFFLLNCRTKVIISEVLKSWFEYYIKGQWYFYQKIAAQAELS